MADEPVPAVSDSTTLAIERTYLASDRTMMAWVRTATSLITFGFSVYKFFDIERAGAAAGTPDRLIGPREFALLLITVGLVSLIFATLQRRQSMQHLRARYRTVPIPRSLAGMLAGLISLLGVLALWAVVFRL